MANRHLDCKGVACPMPIVCLSKEMKMLQVGEQLSVEASDPAFGADLRAWAQRFGHRIVEFEDGTIQRAVIEKVGCSAREEGLRRWKK